MRRVNEYTSLTIDVNKAGIENPNHRISRPFVSLTIHNRNVSSCVTLIDIEPADLREIADDLEAALAKYEELRCETSAS